MSRSTGVLHYYFDANLEIRQSEASLLRPTRLSLEM